MSRRHESNL